MRVLILTHRDLLPPRGARARAPGSPAVAWATEQDVLEGLERLGHAASFLGLDRSLAPLRRALRLWRPHVVLNLLEEFQDDTRRAAAVVALLERGGVAVTGCGAHALRLAHHKPRAKRRLALRAVPVAAGFEVPRGRRAPPCADLPWPRVVKSATAHGSEGLTRASIVHSPRAQAAQVAWVHRRVRSAALVERYLEGRELYVGVLAGRALPPCELHRARPGSRPWIATARTKWDPAYQRAHGLAYGLAAPLAAPARRRVARVARAAALALGVEELARVDLRLDDRGRPWVIEVNANPDLLSWGELATSGRRAGLAYDALLARLLARALRRSGRGARAPRPAARPRRAP